MQLTTPSGDQPNLVQRYADLKSLAGGMTPSVRGMRFNRLLADVLERDGILADSDERGPNGEVDVSFAYDGTWYLLEAKWESTPIDADPVRKLHDMLSQRRPGTMGILASWSAFNDSAGNRAKSTRDLILLDRSHIEALIAGTVTAPALIDAANRHISVYGNERPSLSALLRPRGYIPPALSIGVPDGFTPAAVAAPDGIDARVLAYGADLRGLAARERCLVATTESGLIEFDPAHPKSRVVLELPDLEGSVFADADGAFIGARQHGVLRASTDRIQAFAGGYSQRPMVINGRDGAPWLLDRSFTSWPGNQHARLVAPGGELGSAQSYDSGLPAGACVTACWLGGDRFFVLGEGSSAVVDISSGESHWVVTPVGRPRGLVRLNDDEVLVVGWDRYMQVAVVATGAGESSKPVAVNLAGPIGGAVAIDGQLYVIAGAPVSSSTVVPVIAQLDLGHLVAA